MLVHSATELIGNTPLLELKNYAEKYKLKAKIFAKLEYFNPAGSAKDRIALAMINDAEEKGLLKKGGAIVEPTSGNTGIGLAAVAAARGYKAIFTMPETMSEERRILLKAYGAEVVLTDGKRGMAGAIEKAEEIRDSQGAVYMGQFINPANPKAHYETTGPEIYRDLDGKVDILVAGVGTGGTISGAGKFLKEKINGIKAVAVEPANSPVLSKGYSGAHKIQGIGAGFVPKTCDVSIIDEIIAVSDENALQTGKEIGTTEGFLAGISGGAALYAAKELALRQENAGKNIVVVLTDSGDRYLSTELYR